MNKVEIIFDSNRDVLEKEINKFAREHEILQISITATTRGYCDYYTAAVLYKA